MYIHKKEHLDEEAWKTLGKGDKMTQEKWREDVPVNLRVFDGVEWEELRAKGLVVRGDWSKVAPAYVVPE